MSLPNFQPSTADIQALQNVFDKLGRRRRNLQTTANTLTLINRESAQLHDKTEKLNEFAETLANLIRNNGK
ncbi:hypothetical protein DASB73_004110 [Starmerella bacillaris]|uniref:Uncharacterized protein n=1 Tax=Starmerella bacillaris TaxID=1247836 RepID=A0AAV5RFB8_STABA|nr:hypothetical protein DASB73_004110 [Starmerella bacillaris]